jgi:enoyl-[acyl-carrier protein] reductase III
MPIQYDFLGKIALITGSSRGIGKGLALRFAAAGADLVINYKKNEDLARGVAAEIEAMGRRALPIQADIEKPDEIRRMFARVGEVFGGLDILVASAAASAFKPLVELKEHNVDRTFGMIVRSYILLSQEAAKLMAPRGGGKIVAISGGDTSKYQQRHGLLAAAKAAMETITRYIGVELAEQKVIANAVLPGPFDTDSARIYAASTGMDWEIFIRGWVDATPYRRLGTIEDVANVILFLCSPESDWIVGQCIPVDGGFTLT